MTLKLRIAAIVPAFPAVLALAWIAVMSGCSPAAYYGNFQTGKLEGKLVVQWLTPDTFLFIPDDYTPLKFTRSNGDVIEPGRVFTDGGSIPRPLWILRNYSPWGYAPAFIVHDWLFVMKHCQPPGYKNYTYEDAALVMAEIMKTMMESERVDVDKATVLSMYLAVSSPVAESLWNEGKCEPPPAESESLLKKKPIAEFELNFDQ